MIDRKPFLIRINMEQFECIFFSNQNEWFLLRLCGLPRARVLIQVEADVQHGNCNKSEPDALRCLVRAMDIFSYNLCVVFMNLEVFMHCVNVLYKPWRICSLLLVAFCFGKFEFGWDQKSHVYDLLQTGQVQVKNERTERRICCLYLGRLHIFGCTIYHLNVIYRWLRVVSIKFR